MQPRTRATIVAALLVAGAVGAWSPAPTEAQEPSGPAATAEPIATAQSAGTAEAAVPVELPERPDHSAWDDLLHRYVTHYGVRYAAWHANDVDRQSLLSYVEQLQVIEPSRLAELDNGRDEELAYWINLYNALTVRLILGNYPVDSIKDLGNLIRTPWKRSLVRVEGEKLSLDEIENDIIRPRFREPRIHFALSCASIGCPPLREGAYLPEALDTQLEHQTAAFLGDPKRNWVDEEERLVLSKIFDWYEDDFEAAAGSVPDWVRPYMPMAQELKPGEDIDIEYTEYDWSLNESPEAP